MYKISVIVTVYNKENYIEQCLDTIVNQTYQNIEVILVDDGATDMSGYICDRYSDENANVRTIHKENGGLVSAWKRGVMEATGDYIAFVDCDDWIDLDMFEILESHVTGRNDEIILSDYIIERCKGNKDYVYQDIEPGEYLETAISEKIIPVLWGLEDRAVCRSRCMKLFASELAKRNAHYGDERLGFSEDTSLTIPCVLDSKRLYFCDHKAMYHYRFVNDSMVHYYDRKMLDSIELCQTITEQAIRDKVDSHNMLMGFSTTELIEMSRREYVFWLMYAVKNEAKAPSDVYINRIQETCLADDNRRLILGSKISVKHTSNKLIYKVMKNPSRVNCMILRGAMYLWEHR